MPIKDGKKAKIGSGEEEITIFSKSNAHALKFAYTICPAIEEHYWNATAGEFDRNLKKTHHAIKIFKLDVSQLPFLAVIQFWAEHIVMDWIFGMDYLATMRELLRLNLIPCLIDGKPITVQEFARHAMDIFDNIRCYHEWPIEKREEGAAFYNKFAAWLSETTFELIPKLEDPDRKITTNRKLPYDTYIKLIQKLNIRERVLAKIFYLGGSRTMEEVLALKIGDINFKKTALTLSGEHVQYPRHVLQDLSEYLDGRKSGYVFIGKHGEMLDRTVPYRSLKTITSKLNFTKSLSFKDFVENS